jgi:hypothetical protein
MLKRMFTATAALAVMTTAAQAEVDPAFAQRVAAHADCTADYKQLGDKCTLSLEGTVLRWAFILRDEDVQSAGNKAKANSMVSFFCQRMEDAGVFKAGVTKVVIQANDKHGELVALLPVPQSACN